jgi:RNA polymerase sigma-70 factor, ECF subfamily
VQQTLVEAHEALASFRGDDLAVQAAWLRQILARNLANAVRDLTRAKRDVRKERSLQAAMDNSASQLEGWLAAEQSSPSQKLERHERALQLAEALAQLPEAQRDAVVLRHFQGLSLAQIAVQLHCTTAAVTGLLQRGLKNLRKSLADWDNS